MDRGFPAWRQRFPSTENARIGAKFLDQSGGKSSDLFEMDGFCSASPANPGNGRG
jgi:hypothetical protein